MKILILLGSAIENDSRVKNLINVLSSDKNNNILLLCYKAKIEDKILRINKKNVTIKRFGNLNRDHSLILSVKDFLYINLKNFLFKKTLNKNYLRIFKYIFFPITLICKFLIFLNFKLLKIIKLIYWAYYSTILSTKFVNIGINFKPDVIHANELVTLKSAYLIKKVCNSKLIYDSHELETDRNFKIPIFIKWLRFSAEKKYINLSDHVITVSESISNYLSILYKIKKPTVVYNAPLISKRKNKSNIFLKYINEPNLDRVNIIVYIGLISFNRGLENLVYAFNNYLSEKCNNKKNYLFIIGPKAPSFINDPKFINLYSINKNIFILNPVKQDQITNIFSYANVSVIPIQNCCNSYNFCFPNKLLESIFSNIPVAVSNLRELSSFVKKYKCGEIFNETDPKDIAIKIIKILSRNKSEYITTNKINKIKSIYSIEIQSKKIKNIYSNI